MPLLDHLVDEAARLLASELRRWPLAVEEVDPATGADLAPLLEPGSRRPPDVVFQEALRLAGWDLAHEHDAYDDYIRNRRYAGHGIADADRPALLFIARWLMEQLFALAHATEGRVDRRALARVLAGLERDLTAPRAEA